MRYVFCLRSLVKLFAEVAFPDIMATFISFFFSSFVLSHFLLCCLAPSRQMTASAGTLEDILEECLQAAIFSVWWITGWLQGDVQA